MFAIVDVFPAYESRVDQEESSATNQITKSREFKFVQKKKKQHNEHLHPFLWKPKRCRRVHGRFERFLHPIENVMIWEQKEFSLRTSTPVSFLVVNLLWTNDRSSSADGTFSSLFGKLASWKRINMYNWRFFFEGDTNCAKTCSVTNTSTFTIRYETFD